MMSDGELFYGSRSQPSVTGENNAAILQPHCSAALFPGSCSALQVLSRIAKLFWAAGAEVALITQDALPAAGSERTLAVHASLDWL